MSYCVVILRTPPYWLVRVASCNFKLAGNAFHGRSSTASDTTCKLGITFVDESKDFYREKSGQSSCRSSKTVLDCESSPEKAVPTQQKLLIEVFATSVNCLFRRHPRTPASCDTIVCIQPWTRNEKIGSNWVQTWMFGRQTFQFRWGARHVQMWAHHSL